MNKEINLVCTECGATMEYEHVSILPGSSDEGYFVNPCCDTEDTKERLDCMREDTAPEIEKAADSLRVAVAELILAIELGHTDEIPEATQEVKDLQTSLTARIDELHEQFN